MGFRQIAPLFRASCARAFTVALALALLLVTQTQTQAADPEPKRVMMLHSFGLRFRPWTDYSEAIRAEISKRGNVDFRTTRF
jgi:purine nucleoside permease